MLLRQLPHVVCFQHSEADAKAIDAHSTIAFIAMLFEGELGAIGGTPDAPFVGFLRRGRSRSVRQSDSSPTPQNRSTWRTMGVVPGAVPSPLHPLPATGSPRYRNPGVKPGWYKARQRSITPRQKRLELALWPLLGLTLEHGKVLNLDEAFGRTAPRVLEIGCGGGEALVQLAAARPDHDFLGVDWFRSGLCTTLGLVHDAGLTNVRVVRSDAARLLATGLPAEPLFDEIFVLFPDPWRGSTERRVVRPETLLSISRRMRQGGLFRFASDVAGYADDVESLVQSQGGWETVPVAQVEAQKPGHFRPDTKYARDGLVAGRTIDDICFRHCCSL